MPIVFDPPVSPPLPPPVDDGSELWQLFYESLGYHLEDDAATGFALQKWSEGICSPLQPTYDLIRPRLDEAGWAIALDPDEAPADGLGWLSQWPGVVLTPEMTEAQERDEIRQPTGWKRAQPETLRIATRRTLKPVAEEELLVIIRPRTPSVGHHYIRTLLSQTPEPERTKAVLRAKLPAWEVLDYEAIDGVTFADITAKFVTFGDLADAFPTFRDMAEVLPTEL
jgi:hypothetical protein